jgi:hypothetical protein
MGSTSVQVCETDAECKNGKPCTAPQLPIGGIKTCGTPEIPDANIFDVRLPPG